MGVMDAFGLSVFFPCYNDAGTITTLIAEADTVAREFTDNYEILVVDDGSSDTSRKLLSALKDKYPHLRLIFHESNKGYGAALRSGFANSTKDLVFYTDGDGQYDVAELRKFLRVMQEGIDAVNGYKIRRNDPPFRVIWGIFYLRLMRLLFNIHCRDISCDFRLIRRRVFEHIKLTHDSGAICLELVKKIELAGFRSVDFPVHHYRRAYGASQFSTAMPLLKTGVNLVRLWCELMIRRNTPVDVAYRKKGSS